MSRELFALLWTDPVTGTIDVRMRFSATASKMAVTDMMLADTEAKEITC